jgi:hypothetical protein
VVPAQTLGLTQAVERAQQSNEGRIAERINPPKLDIGSEELRHLRRFKQWCSEKGVRALPARPASVAAWIANEAAAGLAVEAIEDSLRAIEAIHTNQNLANPVACPAPRAELQKLIGAEGPRSWKKSERLLFASLPPEVRAVIARRARQDEIALRTLQNSVAALKQQRKELPNG